MQDPLLREPTPRWAPRAARASRPRPQLPVRVLGLEDRAVSDSASVASSRDTTPDARERLQGASYGSMGPTAGDPRSHYAEVLRFTSPAAQHTLDCRPSDRGTSTARGRGRGPAT